MESVVKLVAEKAGISETQAKTALDTVVFFLKDKMPASLTSQVESLINGENISTGNTAEEIKDKISGVFGM